MNSELKSRKGYFEMEGLNLVNQPVLVMLFLGVLSLLPFLVMMTTSFVKMVAVLSILRTAVGTPQIPPNSIVTGLALVLSIFVMSPVLVQIQGNFEERQVDCVKAAGTVEAFNELFPDIIESVKPPVMAFMTQHAHEDNLLMLGEFMENQNGTINDPADNPIVLITAFVLSELKEAFQIGFLLFLPFVLIDLVVANILQAMGMVMLSPTTISLPFKLLLFVLADGWLMLTQGLLAGYMG